MKNATIFRETKSLADWSTQSGVPAAVIEQRISEAYRDRALLIPVATWNTWPRTRPARPQSDWEWAIHALIWRQLPQFRFDIICGLVRDIGMAELTRSKLTVLLNRGAYTAAIERIHEFYGPEGRPIMSWMMSRADNVRCWGDPYER